MATKKRGGSEDSETKAKPSAKAKAKAVAKSGEDRPKLHASHRSGTDAGARKGSASGPAKGPRPPRSRAAKPPPSRKAPLAPPRRAAGRRSTPPEALVEPSAETRELALAIAAAGMEKKAIGIEILQVAGKVDYADFLVVMTGRSDRHVQALAAGIEEALRQRKVRPLSIEGLASASWVLIDFGDVVVHVFQEETRQVYDIEGLWIDANRVPVPMDGAETKTLS